MKVLFIWRSGIKWYEKFHHLPHAIYDPKNDRFLYGSVNPEEEVLIVDDEVASGMTLYRTIRQLRLRRYKIACWDMEGTFQPDVPLPVPTVNAPLITFTGLAAVGKSFIAYGLSQAFNLPYIKWGDFASLYAGKYGEELERVEQKDPFFLARQVYEHLKRYDPKTPVILDNPKKEEQVIFTAFSSRRPLILIHVDIEPALRDLMLRFRKDSDDVYRKERDELFGSHAEKLKEKAIQIRIDENDHRQALWILSRHGFSFRGFYPNTLFFKPAILDWIYKASTSPRGIIRIEEEDGLSYIPKHYIEHYSERYAKLLKDERKRKIALQLSIAYRLIDDILDEHNTRNGHTAFHIEKSVFEALLVAALLIGNARSLLTKEEAEKFQQMTRILYRAVSLELEFELNPERKPTLEEYAKTLEREAGFRAFLYYLAGKDPNEGWRKGIEAQIEDDLKGAEKWGREDTEKRLNRPAASFWRK